MDNEGVSVGDKNLLSLSEYDREGDRTEAVLSMVLVSVDVLVADGSVVNDELAIIDSELLNTSAVIDSESEAVSVLDSDALVVALSVPLFMDTDIDSVTDLVGVFLGRVWLRAKDADVVSVPME